jgi:hypothetical protein
MKNIRNKVFETNSSSTHSVSIVPNTDGIYDTIIPIDGTIILTGGEFGWEWEKYNTALVKANYAAVFTQFSPAEDQRNLLIEVLKEQTGARRIKFSLTKRAYIDHQSSYIENGEARKAFENKETLRNWIFNPKCYLFTGNDNENSPPNFYDPPGTKYEYSLQLEDREEKCSFPSYPDKDQLTTALYYLVSHVLEDLNRAQWSSDQFSIIEKRWKYLDQSGKILDSFSLLDDNIVIMYNHSLTTDKRGRYSVNEIINVKFILSKINNESTSS